MEILKFLNNAGKVVELTKAQAETLPQDEKGNLLSSGDTLKPYTEPDAETEKKVTAEMNKVGSNQAIALMKANEIDPALIKGTGNEGGITVNDVRAYMDANGIKDKNADSKPAQA